MLVGVYSSSCVGVDGNLSIVEVYVGMGLPSFDIVNAGSHIVKSVRGVLGDAAVASGFKWPLGRIVVNYANSVTADVKPFMLPTLLGVLAASEQIVLREPVWCVGEVDSDGNVGFVPGIVSRLACVEGETFRKFVPRAVSDWCDDGKHFMVDSLNDLVSEVGA